MGLFSNMIAENDSNLESIHKYTRKISTVI